MSVPLTAASRPPSPGSGLVAAALADVCADLEELLFLYGDGDAKLDEGGVEFGATGLHEPTRRLLLGEVDAARRRYRASLANVAALRARAGGEPPSRRLVEELAAARGSLADRLRIEQALTAALVGAADWQSPSFLHSLAPAAGRQEGRIRAHWNDYKRDRHLDAGEYERRYIESMVDGPAGLRALLTSCGMAAFTTVLSFLLLERKLEGPVLAGRGLYHESRLLLERAVPGRLCFVDEVDTPGFLRAVDEHRPGAIFLDSLSNTRWMPVAELEPVLERLRGTDTYLVVDNTGLSVGCQPFARAGESVRLLVFESLLKYAQHGLDRGNAGVIVARGDDAERLAEYREHLGTNIGDVAVHALPRPDRLMLERRLARLQRNALFLATRLAERASASVTVVHPGLPTHPSACAAARFPFRGGCLSIVFRAPRDGVDSGRAFVEAAIAEAAKRGVPLLAGSSFGFDTTRVYLAAARAGYGEPFVRIAAGTEHRLALEPLAEALAAAVAEVLR